MVRARYIGAHGKSVVDCIVVSEAHYFFILLCLVIMFRRQRRLPFVMHIQGRKNTADFTNISPQNHNILYYYILLVRDASYVGVNSKEKKS